MGGLPGRDEREYHYRQLTEGNNGRRKEAGWKTRLFRFCAMFNLIEEGRYLDEPQQVTGRMGVEYMALGSPRLRIE